MFGSGNTFSMVELWESMWLIRNVTPWVYDNSLMASLPFMNAPMDMSKLFLVSLLLGYLGNFAYAAIGEDMNDPISWGGLLFVPNVPGLNIIALPYLMLVYVMLLMLFHVLGSPVILFNIFVNGDLLHGVTLVAYLGSVGLAALAMKLN
jgi:hypothetical protein